MAGLEKVVSTQIVEIEVGGKNYTLSPLTLGDLAELRQWSKRKRLRAYLEEAKLAGISDSTQAHTIDLILNSSVSENPLAVDTEESLRMIVYLSLKHKHRGITLEQVDFPIQELPRLNAVISSISIPGRQAGNPPAAADSMSQPPSA